MGRVEGDTGRRRDPTPSTHRTPESAVTAIRNWFRKFTGPVPSRDIALVRHRRRHLSVGASLFAEVARAVVGPTPSMSSMAPFPLPAPSIAG